MMDATTVNPALEVTENTAAELPQKAASATMTRTETARTEASSTTTAATDNISSSNSKSDVELLEEAAELVSKERYLVAARLLRQVQETSLLSEEHQRYVVMADQAQSVYDELLGDPEESDTWIKQGETHGDRDFMIYYKVDEDTRLTCRIETPIETSMLVPIISVFNESELYKTWMPSWKVPKLGLKQSQKLKEMGRGNQLIQLTVDMPTMINNREVAMHAYSVDDIDENNVIIIHSKSCEPGAFDGLVTEPERNVTRVDFDAAILFRPCAPDHPVLQKSKANYPANEKLLLCSFAQQMDAHVTGVPVKMINFFTRTVLGKMWGGCLSVASDIRDGSRPQFLEAIEAKQDLYDWIDQRVLVMFQQMENDDDDDDSKQGDTANTT